MRKDLYYFLNIFIPLLIILSLYGCCASSNKDIDQNKKVDKKSSIPPDVNSAEVEAEIINTKTLQGYTNSKIKILQVNSYGASVPPLPPGKIIEAEIAPSSIKKSKLPEEEIFKTGLKRTIVLEHLVVPPNVSSPSWRIISIE
jgi:hypothetical protein